MLTTFKTRLLNKIQATPNVLLFRFELVEPKEINFKAGQYLMLKINNQCRLYSICSPDFIKESFELVVEIVSGGVGSNYFNNLKVGNRVDFQGPAGMFTLRQNNKPKIFLATGTGIAPIRSMIYSIVSNQQSVMSSQQSETNSQRKADELITKNRSLKTVLFWGLRTRQDVYFFEELKQLSNETMGQFKFYICLSREKDLAGLDGRYFMLGHINDGLEQLISNFPALPAGRQFPISNFEYYICGGRDMVSSMVTFLQKQGINKENIFFEKF